MVLILFGISIRHGQATDKKLLMGLKITNAGADQELAVLKTPNLGANGTIGKRKLPFLLIIRICLELRHFFCYVSHQFYLDHPFYFIFLLC